MFNLVVVLYCAAMAWTCLAHSAEDATESDAYPLGEIFVLGRQSEVAASSTIFKITAREIADMGATTLADVLERVPGVSLRVGGQGTPRVDIRGFKTRHVLLLLNGIPINDTYDGQFDPSSFPVEQIAEVNVITGGGSVLYGSNGNGGVINIITKKGRKGIHGTAGGEYGTEDAWVARASLSAAADKANVFIGANHEERDAYPLSDDFKPTGEEDGDKRENSDFKRNSIFTVLGYDASDNTHMGVTLNWYQGENGVPPTTDSEPTSDFNESPKYDRVDDVQGYSVQLALSHCFDRIWGVKGWIYKNKRDILKRRYDDDTYTTYDPEKGSEETDTTTAVTGINTQLSFDPKEWLATTFSLIYEDHTWKSDGFIPPSVPGGGGDGWTSAVGAVAVDLEERINITSAAMEFEVKPQASLGFVLGAGQHFRDGNVWSFSSTTDTSYVLGAHYDASETTRLKASHSRKVRFPTLKQLYDRTFGDPNLKAEVSYHYEIGVEQQLPAESSLSISIFYTDVEDHIEKLNYFYLNTNDYVFQGIDAALETRFIDNLLLRLSYSFLDAEDKYQDTERDELRYRTKNKYAIECTYGFAFGLKLHADMVHVADQYYYYDVVHVADSYYYEYGTSSLLKGKLKDYTVLNAKISQSLFDNRVDVYVRGENLLDEDYEQNYDLPQAGLTVYVGVDVRF